MFGLSQNIESVDGPNIESMMVFDIAFQLTSNSDIEYHHWLSTEPNCVHCEVNEETLNLVYDDVTVSKKKTIAV